MSDFTDAEDEQRRYRAVQLAVQLAIGSNAGLTFNETIGVADAFVDYMKNGTVA